MFSFDKQLTLRIHGAVKKHLDFWKFLTLFGLWGFVLYFIGMWIRLGFPFGRLIDFALVSAISFVVAVVLHYIIRRPRPTFMATGYRPNMHRFSFPSIHASIAFAMATAIILMQYQQAGDIGPRLVASVLALIFFANLISVSRIAVGVHYLFDVWAGGLLGIGIAAAVILL